jgi:hypothetical protein
MITSIILSYVWVLIIPALLFGAVACYIYVPVVGKLMAIALCSLAAAYAAYELGYADRGKLDKSAQLQQQLSVAQSNLVQAQVDAASNKQISDDAATREALAEKVSSDLQGRVTSYEQQLAERDAQPETIVKADTKGVCPTVRVSTSCRLSAADVAGLRAITRHRSSRAPRAP